MWEEGGLRDVDCIRWQQQGQLLGNWRGMGEDGEMLHMELANNPSKYKRILGHPIYLAPPPS